LPHAREARKDRRPANQQANEKGGNDAAALLRSADGKDQATLPYISST